VEDSIEELQNIIIAQVSDLPTNNVTTFSRAPHTNRIMSERIEALVENIYPSVSAVLSKLIYQLPSGGEDILAELGNV